MLYWSLIFLVLATVSGLFGFGGIVTGMGAGAAKALFFIFLTLFVVTLIAGWIQGPRNQDWE